MRQSKYTAARLAPLVATSRSLAEVLGALKLKPTGGNYRWIAFRIRFLGLDAAHFSGKSWARGQTAETSAGVGRSGARRSRTNAEVFVENSPETCGARIARRLIRLGREYACSVCSLREWKGKPLKLHVDHLNGINNDNRLENLRFLCPNCHSQTATYCRKGRGATAR